MAVETVDRPCRPRPSPIRTPRADGTAGVIEPDPIPAPPVALR